MKKQQRQKKPHTSRKEELKTFPFPLEQVLYLVNQALASATRLAEVACDQSVALCDLLVEKRVITRDEFDSAIKTGRERGVVAVAMHRRVGPLLEVLAKSREFMRLWREGEEDSAEATALLRQVQELLRQAKAAEQDN